MLRQGTNWMIYNPHAYIEGGAEGSFTLHLVVISLTLNVKVLLGKYTPLDFQLAWDLDEKSRVCYSYSWFWEVFDFEVWTEWEINECAFGLLGYLDKKFKILGGQADSDLKECTKRGYYPNFPVF